MRRANGLVAISRRDFCAIAGVAGAGLALPACTDGGAGAVQTGPLGGTPQPDASKPPIDGSMVNDGSMGDASMATCTGSPVDVGAPSMFTLNTPVYFSTAKFFVVRDSGGLYALTARCTHEGATCVVQSSLFYCPRHGAEFTFNGGIISGPVISGLVHYGMCTMGNGHVGVQTSMTVSQSTRLVA
jgi:nitrite reductase/ring-hydroxylating ferredoxin subunit